MTVQSDSDELAIRIDRLSDRPLIPSNATLASRALWAVASIEAERYTASVPGTISGQARPAMPVPDALALLHASQKAHIPLRLLRPESASEALRLDTSDEARARMYLELSNGEDVLIAEKAFAPRPIVGWWLVDPGSGFVNDETESGGHEAGAADSEPEEEPAKDTEIGTTTLHQDAAETAEQEEEAAEEEEPARRFYNQVCKFMVYTAFAIAAVGGAKSGNPVDIFDALNKALGLSKKADDCKQKQKKGGAKRVKTSASGSSKPPPKPPKPPRQPRVTEPKSPPPKPDKSFPPPQGKDRYGWGPNKPEALGPPSRTH